MLVEERASDPHIEPVRHNVLPQRLLRLLPRHRRGECGRAVEGAQQLLVRAVKVLVEALLEEAGEARAAERTCREGLLPSPSFPPLLSRRSPRS